MATAFHHVGISCKDPQTIERFYSNYFGFQRARVIPGAVVFLKSGDTRLELFQAQGESPAEPAAGSGPEYPGWRHLAFVVDDVDAKLAEMGGDARVTLGPLSFDDVIPGWRTVWVADPEGNIVEISQGYRDESNPAPLE